MKRKSFTLIELLTVAAILAILAAIFISAVTEVQAMAYRVNCGGAMSQNYMLFVSYTSDYSMSCPAEYSINNDSLRLRSSDGTQRLLYNLYMKPGIELPASQKDWPSVFRCGAYAFNGSRHGSISDAGIGFNQTSSGYPELRLNSIPRPARKVVMMDWPASWISGDNGVFSSTSVSGGANSAHVPGAGTLTFLDTSAFILRGELNYSWPGPFKDFLRGRHGPGSLNIAFFDGSVSFSASRDPGRDFYMPESTSGFRKLYWDRAGYGNNSVAVSIHNMFNPRLE